MARYWLWHHSGSLNDRTDDELFLLNKKQICGNDITHTYDGVTIRRNQHDFTLD
ncbi:MAG: hypothetical protein UW82_C0014G0010 [candidate division WWE3 bacterium GW2011_GWC2_44_9]|uniref:Uncharacterized protein n=1 Tax=candidate division WWE3 bacterium GW2011_GWC2_44_9 TaxID=1619125 RepID=A0A0G1KMB4_UNCKA|nr:MAG: hypothetical protein UW82_C0014G0010 [candidate division WWE3 bacterium GW2011_GWC2_44_9]